MKAGRADSIPHLPSSPCFPLETTERPLVTAPLCAPPLPWWWVDPAAMPGQRRSRQYRTAIEHHSDCAYTGPHRYTAIQFTALALDWIGSALLEYHIYEHTVYTVHTPMHSPPLSSSPIHTKPYSPHTCALEWYYWRFTLCAYTGHKFTQSHSSHL